MVGTGRIHLLVEQPLRHGSARANVNGSGVRPGSLSRGPAHRRGWRSTGSTSTGSTTTLPRSDARRLPGPVSTRPSSRTRAPGRPSRCRRAAHLLDHLGPECRAIHRHARGGEPQRDRRQEQPDLQRRITGGGRGVRVSRSLHHHLAERPRAAGVEGSRFGAFGCGPRVASRARGSRCPTAPESSART